MGRLNSILKGGNCPLEGIASAKRLRTDKINWESGPAPAKRLHRAISMDTRNKTKTSMQFSGPATRQRRTNSVDVQIKNTAASKKGVHFRNGLELNTMPAKRNLRAISVDAKSRSSPVATTSEKEKHSDRNVVPGKRKLRAVSVDVRSTAMMAKSEKSVPSKRQQQIVSTDDQILAKLRIENDFYRHQNRNVESEKTALSLEIVHLKAILAVRDETIAKLQKIIRKHDSDAGICYAGPLANKNKMFCLLL